MNEIKDASGRTLSNTKNLRAIITYAGKHGRPRVIITPEQGDGAHLRLLWDNGTHASAQFADKSVCRTFCARRRWEEFKEKKS